MVNNTLKFTDLGAFGATRCVEIGSFWVLIILWSKGSIVVTRNKVLNHISTAMNLFPPATGVYFGFVVTSLKMSQIESKLAEKVTKF